LVIEIPKNPSAVQSNRAFVSAARHKNSYFIKYPDEKKSEI